MLDRLKKLLAGDLYDDDISLPESVQCLYWRTIPYDYRPGQLWYWLKCRLYKKFNQVNIKSLTYTYNDPEHVLEHAIFQVLVDFIEKEDPFNHFDTENSHHKNEWAELKELYLWWKNLYLDYHHNWEKYHHVIPGGMSDIVFTKIPGSNLSSMDFVYKPPDAKEFVHIWYKQNDEVDNFFYDELTKRAKRLIELRYLLWT